MRTYYWLPVLLVLLLGHAAVAPANILVEPDNIGVKLNFSGTTVTVTGTAPPGSDVCLRVTSPPVRVPLNRQGKVAGFWMSVQKTVVEGLPKVYHVYTSSKLDGFQGSLSGIFSYKDAMSGARVIEKRGEEHRTLSTAEAQPFVKALVEIYKKKGLYAVHEGKVKIENGRFTAQVEVPAGVPQGDINVTAFVLKNGRVLDRQETSFTVKSAGVVHWLRYLSGTDGPVYGGLAVMIALFTGVAIGMAFGVLDRLMGKGQTGGSGAHAH
ncbi:MAG: TIGR02186 family protein [Firmicutes bacterium]|nr:TIGR02186 family protein [Bacillota bacterium]